MAEPDVTDRPSPNFGARRGGVSPDLIVLHYTAMQDAEGAFRALSDPEREVSAHYLITRHGEIWRLVAESARAWHAGAGRWGGIEDVNSHSIGIELDNDGFSPFSAPLMAALESLLPEIMERWSIVPERVIAHSDMAPGRKIDPGRRFDWVRLARQGLSIAAPKCDAAPDATAFATALKRIGYSADRDPETLLEAFRSRFLPGNSGALNARDMGAACALADRYPVDRGGVDV